MSIIYFIILILVIVLIKNYYNKNIEYYQQILNKAKIPDFTRGRWKNKKPVFGKFPEV